MKKNRRILKRNIVGADGKTPQNFKQAITENEKDPNCRGTAIVYCNRWECHTHFLCLEKNEHQRPKKELSTNN